MLVDGTLVFTAFARSGVILQASFTVSETHPVLLLNTSSIVVFDYGQGPMLFMLSNRRHLMRTHLIRLTHDLRTLHLTNIFLLDISVHPMRRLRPVIDIGHVSKIHVFFERRRPVYELLTDF